MHRGFTALVLIHGLLHGLGFLKAFGLAALPQLHRPISPAWGLVWLAAALLMIVSAWLPPRLLWIVGGLALVTSQACILQAWSDARFGTCVNAVVLLAVVYSFASAGPISLAAEYRRDVAAALRTLELARQVDVTAADLQRLPAPVQGYLRATGSVGRPRVESLRARWKGRMRSDANAPWMAIVAEQVNTFGAEPQRFFKLSATMKGAPVDVYHRFVGSDATFRVRLLSLFPMVDAKGPEMTRAETVTLLNDLCLLAPAALVDPALSWQELDAHSVRVSFTRGAETVRAELSFDGAAQLVDFSSDDRLRASADGRSFTRTRWSTPAGRYRAFGSRMVSSHASARWHAAEGIFAYAEFELLDIAYNLPAPSSGRE